MIAFQDFVPQQLQPPGFLSAAKYASVAQTVQAANEWIHQKGVQVLNVETVLLPNVTGPNEDGAGDAQFVVAGMTTWYQFVRVWYTHE